MAARAPGGFLGRYFTLGFYGLLLVFLGVYLSSIDYGQFENAQLVWPYLVLASLIALAYRYWQVFIWFVLLRGLGATGLRRSAGALTMAYAKSWLGRYVPGAAPWILGKVYFASRHGISRSKLAVSSLLEGGLQVVVLMSAAFGMLALDPRLDVLDERLRWLMVGVLVVGLTCVTPPVFNRVVSLVYRIVRRKTLEAEHLLDGATAMKGVALYFVGALLSGLSLFCIAKCVYPDLDNANVLFVMGAGNLAAAAGMLAVFAPSGIGVREGTQLALLSLLMPTELALLVTVVTRLWGVAMDFVFLGLSKVLEPYLDRTGSPAITQHG